MRNVYFDPFGSYTSGFDKGLERQMNVETQTRANREADFNFNNVLPLKYQIAQRENALGAYGFDAAKRNIDYVDQANNRGNTAAEMGFQRDNIALPFGMTNGYVDAANAYTHNNIQNTPEQNAALMGLFRLPQAQHDSQQMFDNQITARAADASNAQLDNANWQQRLQIYQAQQAAINAEITRRGGVAGVSNPFYADMYNHPAPAAPGQLPQPFNMYPYPQQPVTYGNNGQPYNPALPVPVGQ